LNGKNEIVFTLGTKKIQFRKVELKIEGGFFQNVFADKNNKTLSETLEHRRYKKLQTIVSKQYSRFLDHGLGEFLLKLKENKDDNYMLFLNNYGDLEYSMFFIDDMETMNKRGLYAYTVNSKLRYVGRCLDSFKKRINQGYGKIHPKNCYKDGQATNCHLNSLITKNRDSVSLWVCTMEDIQEIIELERRIIEKYSPEWNITSGSNPIIKTREWIGGEKMVNVIGIGTSDNLTDRIREFVWKNYIQPAREEGENELTVRAGDVHKEMFLKSRMPAVCSALKSKIDKMYDLEIIRIRELPSGQGANVYVTYKII